MQNKRGRTTDAQRWHWTWLWFAPALAALTGIGSFFGAPLLFGPIVMTKAVVRADLVQMLVASSHVETPCRVSVSNQTTGVVAAVRVGEGLKVNTGDLLIRLDDSEARASVVLAEGQVAQAEARVRQMRRTAGIGCLEDAGAILVGRAGTTVTAGDGPVRFRKAVVMI